MNERHLSRCLLGVGLLLVLACVPKPSERAREASRTEEPFSQEAWIAKCDAGDAEACFSLAHRHLRGLEVEKDVALGLQYLQRSCEGGASALGCFRLSELYATGHLPHPDESVTAPVDPERAASYARQCCPASFVCCWQELELRRRTNQPAELIEVTERIHAACENSPDPSCESLARLYEQGDGGVPSNPGRAASLFAATCEGVRVEGCAGLGRAYERGAGVEKDAEKARAAYERSCEARRRLLTAPQGSTPVSLPPGSEEACARLAGDAGLR